MQGGGAVDKYKTVWEQLGNLSFALLRIVHHPAMSERQVLISIMHTITCREVKISHHEHHSCGFEIWIPIAQQKQ